MKNTYTLKEGQLEIIEKHLKKIKSLLKQKGGSSLNPEIVEKALLSIIDFSSGGIGFLLKVEYSESIENRLKRTGLVIVSKEINSSNFPPFTKLGKMAFEHRYRILNFGKISSLEAKRSIKRMGMKETYIEDLLEFAAAHPEVQCVAPVACLGSVHNDVEGDLYAPFLHVFGRFRGIWLARYEEVWREDYFFLVKEI